MGQKRVFPKVILDQSGHSDKCFEPILSPLGRVWAQGKFAKCLEKEPFWEQKWVKNGSKTRFSKSDPGPLGVHETSVMSLF